METEREILDFPKEAVKRIAKDKDKLAKILADELGCDENDAQNAFCEMYEKVEEGLQWLDELLDKIGLKPEVKKEIEDSLLGFCSEALSIETNPFLETCASFGARIGKILFQLKENSN